MKDYFRRIERMKQRLRRTEPEIDLENARILTRVFKETAGEPLAVRKAKAFKAQCEEKTIEIFQDELIVGCPGSKLRGGLVSVDTCWSVLADELETISTRPQDPFYLSPENKKMFLEEIQPYWQGKAAYDAWVKQIPEDTKILRDNGVIFIDKRLMRGSGEVTASYKQIIDEGLVGIKKHVLLRKQALNLTEPGAYEQDCYLSALLITLEGLEILAARYGEEALRLASIENDCTRQTELLQIAKICQRVPKYPARTFHEALQSLYFYHMSLFIEQNAEGYNPGRMDQYLYPYYQEDIRSKRMTDEGAQELLDCLWVKLNEVCLFQDKATSTFVAGYPTLQNVCVGGVDSLGRDAVNELSYLILQATEEVRLSQPSLSVRYSLAKNSNRFLRRIVELIKLGTGFPAFHNDDVGVRMLMNKGVPLKEAFDWNPCGCVETSLEGRMKQYTSLADINLGSVCELVLTNGKNPKTNEKISIETGDPRVFGSYYEFKEAVKAQMTYVIEACVKGSHVIDELSMERPVPVLSLTHRECIEKGLDYSRGGAKYTCGNGITSVGVADLINTLAAVKELVYDRQCLTMDELLTAIENDFDGYETIRCLCEDVPKYGNANPVVDEIASEMFTFIADEIESYRSKFGKMTPGILPVTVNTLFGLSVGALPSGRKASSPLADGVSPSGGTDYLGPNAILRSVSNIPHDRFVQGTLLNMKIAPELIRTEKGITQMMAMLKSICSLGIFHAHFNVVDRDMLLHAQEAPEEYRGLLIRVAGYTTYFVDLSQEVQNEIINRTPQRGLVAGEVWKEQY
ncbi:glycyl radical protein [Enterococcus sp. AZ072]|uniref:glycyl radical protein n=1 Tax=unclassified Enterococcus TaxID=2608891 RepID=UPI003D2CE98D